MEDLRVRVVVESARGKVRALIPAEVVRELLEARGVVVGEAWERAMRALKEAVMKELRR